MALFVNFIIKKPFAEIQSQSDRPHDADVEVVARLFRQRSASSLCRGLRRSGVTHWCVNTYLVEIQHGLLETWSAGLMRPHVSPFTVPVPPDLHRLLEIRGFGSESSNFIGIL